MRKTSTAAAKTQAYTEQERKPKITNIYKGISTEERIRLYLKICESAMSGEENK